MSKPGPKGITIDQILAAIDQTGTQDGAAALLGLNTRTISSRLKYYREGRSRENMYSDEYYANKNKDAPPRQRDDELFKGRSVLWNPETGETKLEWYKTDRDKQEQYEQLKVAVDALKDEIPTAKPEPAPKSSNDDLCACYVLSDAHIGMLAFQEETGGENWDTDIAEDTLTKWIMAAVDAVPDAHTGLLIQLGDWLHFDGMVPETPASKHSLDTDTRFQLLVRVAIRTLRRVISLMLQKHQRVHVIMADANHDPASGAWLREMFAVLYADDPRITVDTSADTYYAFQWGKVSIFAHHGHKSKMSSLSSIFAGKFRELFGSTTYSYAHVGHLHHQALKEDTMMVTEQHSTLAAPDAYAAKHGYLSKRSASTIIYHKNFGEVGRTTIKPEMLK